MNFILGKRIRSLLRLPFNHESRRFNRLLYLLHGVPAAFLRAARMRFAQESACQYPWLPVDEQSRMKTRFHFPPGISIFALVMATQTGFPSTVLSGSSHIWGHCKTTALTDAASIQRELQDMWDCNGRCPRIDKNWTTAIDAAHKIGFTKMVLVVGGTMRSVPDSATYANDAVTLARAHPDAYIELGNECNLNGFSPAAYATIAKAAYRAIKDGGLPNIVLLGSVGNSSSTVGGYSMLDWCKQLVLNGCVQGQAFDWANYHIYAKPSAEEPWHHLFTPNSAGESCQTVLGNPPFAITEFGASLSKDCGGSEALQAQYLNDWMVMFKAQAQFKLGTQYAMADEAPGSGTGYGLRRLDLSHRPAWDAYKVQAAESVSAASPTPAPPSNLQITSSQ
jgi:hypothetical protein